MYSYLDIVYGEKCDEQGLHFQTQISCNKYKKSSFSSQYTLTAFITNAIEYCYVGK